MITLLPPSLECTFIVLDAEKWPAQPGTTEENCMVGDVNLFLTDLGDPSLGEIEVMIAGLFCLALHSLPLGPQICRTLSQLRLHRDLRKPSGRPWLGQTAAWHPVRLSLVRLRFRCALNLWF